MNFIQQLNAGYIRKRNDRYAQDRSSTQHHNSTLDTEKKTKSLQGVIERMKSSSNKSKNDQIKEYNLNTDTTNDKHNDTNATNNIFDGDQADQELSDILSMPSITLTNDEYFKWVKSQSCSFVTSVSPSTHAIALNPKNSNNDSSQPNRTPERNGINRTETMTTTHTLSSMHNIKDFKETDDNNDNVDDEQTNRHPLMVDYIFDPSTDLSHNSVSPLSFSNPILTNSNSNAEVCMNSKVNLASSHKTSLFELSTSSNRASMNSINNSKCNNDFSNTTNSLLR